MVLGNPGPSSSPAGETNGKACNLETVRLGISTVKPVGAWDRTRTRTRCGYVPVATGTGRVAGLPAGHTASGGEAGHRADLLQKVTVTTVS